MFITVFYNLLEISKLNKIVSLDALKNIHNIKLIMSHIYIMIFDYIFMNTKIITNINKHFNIMHLQKICIQVL